MQKDAFLIADKPLKKTKPFFTLWEVLENGILHIWDFISVSTSVCCKALQRFNLKQRINVIAKMARMT